jgi:hypothetical protein
MRKLTQIQFIEKANKVHHNKYDYSLINYINNRVKIIIICKIHGEFLQLAGNHLYGQECHKCMSTQVGKMQMKNLEDFIILANKVHNNIYDYSLVNYKGNKNKVKIICPIHREFEQTPNNHLNGANCPKCMKIFAAKKRTLTSNEFIKKAISIHGSKYNYSKVEYITTTKSVIIICDKHGEFRQKPSNHLRGRGCLKCSSSISNKEVKWIKSLKNSNIINNYKLILNDKFYNVDGYDPTTNTIYEFYGDYWHGNPESFSPDSINKSIKKSFKELYENTLIRQNKLMSAGYEFVFIWESDFDPKYKLKVKNG